MYQVTGASSLEFKRENIFSSSDGTLIVNLTHEGEGRFLGIPHAEDVVNLGREFGNYKVVRMGNLKIMSIFDRNFPEQNVSQSKHDRAILHEYLLLLHQRQSSAERVHSRRQ